MRTKTITFKEYNAFNKAPGNKGLNEVFNIALKHSKEGIAYKEKINRNIKILSVCGVALVASTFLTNGIVYADVLELKALKRMGP